MKSSLVFFAFGHPEGFGLPIAESLACGCAVIGYTGLGGREIFNLASHHSVAYEVPFGYLYGFIKALESFHVNLQQNPELMLSKLKIVSSDIRLRYSQHAMRLSARSILALVDHQLNSKH
ncbi:hypothetical protein PMIT1320_01840 [Prochlorococcus marinus str. MIT 1320]|nr:hypothetical protein PMIT1320_01840 [Prochlorococcus marinus str. MIT 1320]